MAKMQAPSQVPLQSPSALRASQDKATPVGSRHLRVLRSSFTSCWRRGDTNALRFLERRLTKKLRKRRGTEVRAALSSILHNEVLVTTAAACVLCQGLKPFAAVVEGKPLNWRLVYKSGGMPSSHTSTVTALATAVGLERGLDDDLFAICVVLAAIVMYDAQGVRYAVGKQAEVLNSIVNPQIPNPPPTMISEAEHREAPQAEHLLYKQSAAQASTSKTGPSRSPVLAQGRTVELEGEEARDSDTDTRQRLVGGVESGSDRPPRSMTDKLEVSLSTSGRTAWGEDPSLEGGKNGEAAVSNGSHNPGYRSNGSHGLDTNGGIVGGSDKPGSRGGVEEDRYPEAWRHVPLKEAVGHSKLEVAVGGLAGVVLAFAFHATVFGGRL